MLSVMLLAETDQSGCCGGWGPSLERGMQGLILRVRVDIINLHKICSKGGAKLGGGGAEI